MRTRIMLLFGTILLTLALLGCGGGQEEAAETSDAADTNDAPEPADSSEFTPGEYEDGVYFAQEDGFNERTGWKYMVVLEVEDGEIVSATWEGANRDGGT
ncbi:MAG: hypothetical protein ACLFSV_00950, partial [Alkalispirochaeta sp.]